MNETNSPGQETRIDSLINATGGTQLRAKIYGYADFLHAPAYNLRLSQQRADLLKQQLLARAGSMVVVEECTGRGEVNSVENGSAKGEPAQRRVDLVLERVSNEKKQIKEVSVPVAKDSFPGKTAIEGLKKGESLAIEGLSFEPGRHVLRKSSLPVLQTLLETLQKNPGLKIAIEGHVCCVEGAADGMDIDTKQRQLSVNRARAIYEYLVKNGISPSRLSYEGFGHSRPRKSPEMSAADEQLNRRVEVRVIER